MQYAKNLISTSIFFLVLIGCVFINNNLAQGAPLCGADGYNDPNDPACYTTYSYTVYGSHGGCWYTGGCDDAAFGVSHVGKPPGWCYWSSIACADGATGSWCVNHPCGLECADSYEYDVTNYTCHYISEVKTWSVCANGVQVATDVTWSTKPYVAATCVNIPLTQTCGPAADIKANGSDGPVTINYDKEATISWTSALRDICEVTLSGSGKPKLWDGTSGSQLSGLLTDYVNPTVYKLECASFDGSPSLTDEVAINVTPPPCTPIPGVCAIGPNRCNPGISTTDSLCISGTPADLVSPPIPSSGSAPEVRFTWKCLGSCGGADANNCSSERSDPLIATSSETVWSNCTSSCGGGNRTKEINYHNCYKKTESQACNSQPCPPSYREVTPW